MNAVKFVRANQALPPSLNIDETVIKPTYFDYDAVPSTVRS